MSLTRILILTPDPVGEGFDTRWRDVYAELAAPLQSHGLSIAGRSWTEPFDGADLILPLLVWGYHQAGPAWTEATTSWVDAGLPVRNPPEVLRWNADKTYLGRLAERGVPVTPTLFAERIDASVLEQAAHRFGTEQLIAKPQVSATAWQTIRWSPGAPIENGPTGAAMIQPYLPAIERDGEISLVFFAGTFSHAIRKLPQPGDFRVQPEYRGIISAHEPAPDELAAAQAALDAIEEPLLYARVDLVRDRDARPVLMELELVEPDLYLRFDAAAPGRFADAVALAV